MKPTKIKHTPHMDAFIADLDAFLKAKRGRAAALGRHLFGNTTHGRALSGAVRISRWLARTSNPNGEHVLAIQQWMATQK